MKSLLEFRAIGNRGETLCSNFKIEANFLSINPHVVFAKFGLGITIDPDLVFKTYKWECKNIDITISPNDLQNDYKIGVIDIFCSDGTIYDGIFMFEKNHKDSSNLVLLPCIKGKTDQVRIEPDSKDYKLGVEDQTFYWII